MRDTGLVDTTKLTAGVNEYYSQTYASVTGLVSTSTVPFFPGFSVRMDTGALSLVDEQLGLILVFNCSSYANPTSNPATMVSDTTCTAGPSSNASYGAAAYKDLEFVGTAPYVPVNTSLPTSPQKLFLTSLEDPYNARAELFVQCARCPGGGITASASVQVLR